MIHWQIKFRSLRANELYTVSIYDDLYQGDPIQLRGGANPFETEEDNDRNFFKPVRTQTGYITIIDTGKDMAGNAFDWFDIIPAHAKDRKVVLTDENNVVRWQGFIQPQTFSGNLYQPTQERKFPVMCPLQALASVDIPSTNLGVHTFAYVLDVILDNAGVDFAYLNFQGLDSLDWLQKKVDWLNFLDKEDDGSYVAKYDCLTLLEEICKFWGWTCRAFEDDLWFVCPDDELQTDYVGIEKSDLYDYLEAGDIPQYQEGTWGSVNTNDDIYANTDNNVEVMLGIRKATVTADINKQQVITEVPYDDIMDLYRDNTVQTTQVDDNYNFRLHGGGQSELYDFEDLHMEALDVFTGTPGTGTYLWLGAAYFLITDHYEGNIAYKHNYDWDTRLMIDNSLVGTAKSSDYLFLMRSLSPHNYDHGVLAISGDVGNGGTLTCRLKVGSQWWNGSSWTTTKSTFDIAVGDETAPTSASAGKIISNRQLNGIYNDYDGHGVPVGSGIGGIISFEIVGFEENGAAVPNTGTVGIKGLKIQFVREKSYDYYNDDRSENTYNGTTNKAFEDEVSIDTIFASDDLNAFGLGIIMNFNGTYCNHVSYTYPDGLENSRPEQHLLNRIINRGKYIRMMERIQVRSNLASITPYKKCLTAQMTGYPVAINRYWRDDITEAYIEQLSAYVPPEPPDPPTPVLPYDAEVEYLENTGGSYIDLGIVPDANTGIRIKANASNTTDSCVIGLRQDSGNTRFLIAHSTRFYYGFGVWNGISVYSSYNIVDLNYYNDGKFYIRDLDGVSQGSASLPALSFTPTNSIFLFSVNGYGSGDYTKWKGKIYSVEVTRSNQLVMDLIPVRVGQVGYMYDRVSGELFGNSGTGSFTIGPDKNT